MNVSEYIYRKIKEYGALHFTLLDPEEIDKGELPHIAEVIMNSGSHAVMVGGSTVIDQQHLSDIVMSLKNHINMPIILFPNNVTGITKYADAIWFMSLFNSTNPYYITGAQMLAAPYIKKMGLETLSMAYLIVGEGKAAGFIGQAIPIPLDKPEIAAAYALAAEYFGFKYVYLEAGSGATNPIPANFISKVKQFLSTSMLIVGGGIKSLEDSYNTVLGGADIVVTGSIIEDNPYKLREIVEGVVKGGKLKKNKKENFSN